MKDYGLFMKRSDAYKRLFDPSIGFIRAKNADGQWTEPFDPYFTSTEEGKAMYEEGNAWQYTFFVPHDVRGLAKQSLSFPCFYFTEKYCVLPAFSKFTGLALIRPINGESVFAIVQNDLVKLR